MPFVVDYECEECEHQWEAWLRNSGDSEAECPNCRGINIRRLTGTPSPTKCHDPEVRSEILKKRSLDHSIRTAGRNIERIRETGR